jgi:hypothetical protein
MRIEKFARERREPFRKISKSSEAIAQPDLAANNFTGSFAGP